MFKKFTPIVAIVALFANSHAIKLEQVQNSLSGQAREVGQYFRDFPIDDYRRNIGKSDEELTQYVKGHLIEVRGLDEVLNLFEGFEPTAANPDATTYIARKLGEDA